MSCHGRPETPELALLRTWWRNALPNLNLEHVVKLDPIGNTGKHRLRDFRRVIRDFMSERGRYLITNTRLEMPTTSFAPVEVERLNLAHKNQRGRVLWCQDLALRETMAALSFHIDEAAVPPLIGQIALRRELDPHIRRSSVLCAGMLKAFVHEVGRQLKRTSDCDLDAPADWIAFAQDYLGFCGRPSRGTHAKPLRGDVIRQPPI